MFFKKKEVIDVNECNMDKNLNECDSVNKIRQYQEELRGIKITGGLYETINKYFLSEMHNDATSEILCWLSIFKPEGSYENYFRNLGKDLDVYYSEEKLINDLNRKIYTEKSKLGIK